jgi:hypothetical protein
MFYRVEVCVDVSAVNTFFSGFDFEFLHFGAQGQGHLDRYTGKRFIII